MIQEPPCESLENAGAPLFTHALQASSIEALLRNAERAANEGDALKIDDATMRS